jgi:16S rRNA G1207 methylase RsmC
VSNTLFESAAGSYELHRYPSRRLETLRAWNTADLLLIELLVASQWQAEATLVVNDEQGALTVALEPGAFWTDSALSRRATEENLQRNKLGAITAIPATQPLAAGFSTVAIKVPKLLPYFEYQLAQLAGTMEPGATVFAAGMDKHLSPRVVDLLERHIGPTERHRGRRKARVFTAIRDSRPAQSLPEDGHYYCEALGGELTSMVNVFSRDKIDIGSRFLIEHMGQLPGANNVIDLACGNGILGLVARANGLCGDHLGFCDESAMAIASSRQNARNLLPQAGDNFSFHQIDGLLGYEGDQADLILCNPPFHASHTVDEFVGQRLLGHCADYLKRDGRLCVVANRHLKYHAILKRRFSAVEKVAQNSKFIIWSAQK